MNELGKRIVAYRRRENLTQRQLADKVGVSQSAISRIEKGRDQAPDMRVLSRIAAAFGCTLRDLLPGELLDQVVPTNDADSFYAFCPNPFCSANDFGRAKDGTIAIWWKSGQHYPDDRFTEINFCAKCGSDLVKECPGCNRRLEAAGTRYCQTCGTQVTSRPTDDEWEKITQKIESDEIPF